MLLVKIILAVLASLVSTLSLELHTGTVLDARQCDTSEQYLELPLYPTPDSAYYMVNISVGTPAQNVSVILDTGSADLWIPSADNLNCVQGLCINGSFSSALSRSYQLREEGGFNITYMTSGYWNAGDWANDSIIFEDGSQIPQQLFGVANSGLGAQGLMGLSFSRNLSDPLPDSGATSTVLDSLVSYGLIRRRFFALYLNDINARRGTLLLGGIDRAKYTGDMVPLPLQADERGDTNSWGIALTNITFTSERGTTFQLSEEGFTSRMVLDSGSPGIGIDKEIFGKLASGLKVVNDEYGYWVRCSLNSNKGTLNLGLGGQNGITIHIPLAQMIGTQADDVPGIEDASGGCSFDLTPNSDSSQGALGGPFLRSSYVVFDMDRKIVGIAQAALNKLDSSSIAIMPSIQTKVPRRDRKD